MFSQDMPRPLYYYDVNSLYPSVMKDSPMPVGVPTSFIGDVRKVDPYAFGFFYCDIKAPDGLIHPILQRKYKFGDGSTRTVAALGNWRGWITSAEYDRCRRLGYKFQILKGYTFKTAYIFADYINTMYSLRQQYPKTHPLNTIAKLLMNSLYGRFGMKATSNKYVVINSSAPEDKQLANEILNSNASIVTDFVSLNNNIYVFALDPDNLKYEVKSNFNH